MKTVCKKQYNHFEYVVRIDKDNAIGGRVTLLGDFLNITVIPSTILIFAILV